MYKDSEGKKPNDYLHEMAEMIRKARGEESLDTIILKIKEKKEEEKE